MACLLCTITPSGKVRREVTGTPTYQSSNARKFSRFFLAGASACEVDRQGRILLPSVLRDFAGLEKEVVLVGVGSRIEIWNKVTWAEKNVYDDMEEIAENMEGLGI